MTLYVIVNRFGDYDATQGRLIKAFTNKTKAEELSKTLQTKGKERLDWLKSNYEKLHATPCSCCETETEWVICKRCLNINEHDDMTAYGYVDEYYVEEVILETE